MPNYRVKLLPAELNSLSLTDLSNATVYSILTIPQVVTDMSAYEAPIIINNDSKAARQIVLQDSKLEVKYPMYLDLKKYIVNFNTKQPERTPVVTVNEEESKSNSPRQPSSRLITFIFG